MIDINCNSVAVKELSPKGIVYPSGTVYYAFECDPLFLSFTYNADKDVVTTKDCQALPIIGAF